MGFGLRSPFFSRVLVGLIGSSEGFRGFRDEEVDELLCFLLIQVRVFEECVCFSFDFRVDNVTLGDFVFGVGLGRAFGRFSSSVEEGLLVFAIACGLS